MNGGWSFSWRKFPALTSKFTEYNLGVPLYFFYDESRLVAGGGCGQKEPFNRTTERNGTTREPPKSGFSQGCHVGVWTDMFGGTCRQERIQNSESPQSPRVGVRLKLWLVLVLGYVQGWTGFVMFSALATPDSNWDGSSHLNCENEIKAD